MNTAMEAKPEGDQTARVIDVYSTFVAEILKRLSAVSDSLSEFRANPEHPDAWRNCDFCWFQIRKICEYLALGIVAAHHFDGADTGLQKWRPKELLAEAAKLNDHPTPIQIADGFGQGPDGERQIVPLARPIRADAISAIYGRCSELLHVGSLDRILSGKMPVYEIVQLEQWVTAFQNLAANHALMLPGIQTVLICRTEGGASQFFALGSDGAIWDTSGLPEFEI